MENLVNRTYLEKKFGNKTVLVTGHTGFKGSWLICLLQQLKANVIGYALHPHKPENLYDIINEDKPICRSIIHDIRDKERLKKEIHEIQPDFIFHLAAQPLVRYSYQEPIETFEVNVMGTAYLLDALRTMEKKCTVIIITTDKVYQNKETPLAYCEEDNLGGYDPYSSSKAMAELLTISYRDSYFNIECIDTHNKGIATARAGNVIGGGDWSKDRIVTDIVAALHAGSNIKVRNPDAVRPWQFVLEPLFGYLLLAARVDDEPKKYFGAWNFGPVPEDQLTVSALVDKAILAWGGGSMEIANEIKKVHEAGLLRLDITKAKSLLSWKPLLNSELAIQWTIEWYKQKKVDRRKYTYQQIDQYLSL